MNIELETLIKTILNQAEVKYLSLDDAKEIYLKKHLQNAATRYYYYTKLNRMINLLKDKNVYYTNQITTAVLTDISAELLKKVQPQTINKYTLAIFTMLRYLSEDLELIDMPKVKYVKLTENNIEQRALQEDDIKLLNSYIATKSLRTQLVINLMLTTGVRRTELTRIKLSNINLEDGTIFLQNLDTKAHKSRYLFIMDEVMDILKPYLKAYKPSYYLFEENNKQLTPSAITSIIYRIKKELNLNDLTPHCLRRTFATYMLDNGANIMSVKNLLGHSTLSQTQKYALATHKQQKRDCIAYNPLTLLKK